MKGIFLIFMIRNGNFGSLFGRLNILCSNICKWKANQYFALISIYNIFNKVKYIENQKFFINFIIFI